MRVGFHGEGSPTMKETEMSGSASLQSRWNSMSVASCLPTIHELASFALTRASLLTNPARSRQPQVSESNARETRVFASPPRIRFDHRSLRQSHTVEQVGIARVGAETIELRIDFDEKNTRSIREYFF